MLEAGRRFMANDVTRRSFHPPLVTRKQLENSGSSLNSLATITVRCVKVEAS
jgi:hypothetical protein